MSYELVLKYFPNLTEVQKEQISRLYPLYADWNSKINVVSRKDIDNLYEHHVLHSLAIAKVFDFAPATSIMDLGCGGGFPGIPLAILFPECKFHLVDSIGKKVKVAQAVSDSIGLTNTRFSHLRGEDVKEHFDVVVTRAVMPAKDLVRCVGKKTDCIIALKGGELSDELSSLPSYRGKAECISPIACTKNIKIWNISDYFDEEFFQTKKILKIECLK